MTHDEYADLDGERWSTLNKILDSPAHYRHQLDHGREDTPAFALGRAVHALALEPVVFAAEFAAYQDRRAGQRWRDFQRDNANKTILTRDEYARAAAMADAVRTHPLVTPYLTMGRFEVPMQWTDLATGIRCKARTDWIQPHQGVLVELKTTRSIEMYAMGSDVRRYRYAGQLMFYAAGVEAALGWKVERQIIIAVEKTPPYDVGVFELDTGARQHGISEYTEALARLKSCRASGKWPGRYEQEQILLLPHYATDDLDMGDLPEED